MGKRVRGADADVAMGQRLGRDGVLQRTYLLSFPTDRGHQSRTRPRRKVTPRGPRLFFEAALQHAGEEVALHGEEDGDRR